MRYYNIVIGGFSGSTALNLVPNTTYSSVTNGATNPSALQVELDIWIVSSELPRDAGVKIWGVPLDVLGQANNLINRDIQVFGGFQPGLPLATQAAAHSGLLVSGYILNAFGNWEDTNQSLTLIIRAGPAPTGNSSITGGTPNPRNLAFNWPQGNTMATAIQNALTTAFPGYSVNMNISPNLVFPEGQQGHYQNLAQFTKYVKQTSRAIIGGSNYAGVSIVLTQKTFNVFDGMGNGTATAKPVAIAFTDLIGQPTWQNSPSINFKCAMRTDINVGSLVTLPTSIVTNTAQAQGFLSNQKLAFQGQFMVQSVRHVGNFRQSDAGSWVTVFDANPLTQGAAAN